MNHFFKNIEEILCGTFILTMVSLVILNVFLRYFFSYSIFWAEEVSTICFVWSVFLGATAVYKHRMDIGIDAIVNRLPQVLGDGVRFGILVLLLLINGYIFYMSVVFTGIAVDKPTAVLGVSSIVVNGALVVSFGLTSLHTLRFIVEEFRQVTSPSAD